MQLCPHVLELVDDVATQAAMFLRANSVRRPMDPFSLHRAALAAGDARALAVEALATGAGIRIPRSNPSMGKMKPGEIKTVGVFGKLLDRYPSVAAEAAGAVADAYRGEVLGLRGPFFIAAAVVLGSGAADRAQVTAAFRQSTAAAFEAQLRDARGSVQRENAAAAVLRRRLEPAPEVIKPARPARDVAPGASWAFTGHRAGGGEGAAAPLKRGELPAVPVTRITGRGREPSSAHLPVSPSAAADPGRAGKAPAGMGIVQSRPGSDGGRAEIERFIKERGVTRVPAAFAASSQHAALSRAAAAQKLAAMPVVETVRRPGESAAARYRRVNAGRI